MVDLYLKKKLSSSPNSCLNSRSFFARNHINLIWNAFAHIVLCTLRKYLTISSNVYMFSSCLKITERYDIEILFRVQRGALATFVKF